ncbi:MAG: hypothetical protein L0229_32010 [Blastocatellia bacterium]|nr:hypothetical protein [Blastocatellia bacterium]
MSFDEAISRLDRQAAAYELNILVWGPGKDSGEHFEKRQKIRREINKCFYNADIRFSEDLDLTESLPGIDELDYSAQELWHLAACDICIVLDTSIGAGEEIAYYIRSQHAHKLLILTHEKYKLSTNFPAALRKHQNQLFYDDQQYDSCNLVERVLTRVKTVALGKLIGMRI